METCGGKLIHNSFWIFPVLVSNDKTCYVNSFTTIEEKSYSHVREQQTNENKKTKDT